MTLGQAIYLAAREYAAMGMPIFPIVENAKRPATARGFYDATTDFEQLDKWFDPEAPIVHNIGVCPDDVGCFVVDCDGSIGAGSFDLLSRMYPGARATLTVETPSGGKHFWYRGQMKSSVRKIAPGIDIRGIGGYVLLPPSVIDGRAYKVLPNV
jgi:hypothetical protein